jgi:hypothetical protein
MPRTLRVREADSEASPDSHVSSDMYYDNSHMAYSIHHLPFVDTACYSQHEHAERVAARDTPPYGRGTSTMQVTHRGTSALHVTHRGTCTMRVTHMDKNDMLT